MADITKILHSRLPREEKIRRITAIIKKKKKFPKEDE